MTGVLRWLVAAVLVAAAVAVLFTVVFPWFDRTFVDDPTLDARAAGVHAAS